MALVKRKAINGQPAKAVLAGRRRNGIAIGGPLPGVIDHGVPMEHGTLARTIHLTVHLSYPERAVGKPPSPGGTFLNFFFLNFKEKNVAVVSS